VKYLFAIWLVLCGLTASAQITYETVYVDYDSAWKFKDLKIIPIRQKKKPDSQHPSINNIISLSQALSSGLATVTERGTASTENVHWLRINNNSDKSIMVNSGEIFTGGRQDRMIMHDTILSPSQKDQYVPVMCVEEGRWSEKEKKILYGNFANPHLRKVLDQNKNQVLIWNEINSQLARSGLKSSTMAYMSLSLDKKSTSLDEEYFRFFKEKFKNSDSTIVGFVAVSGNKVIGSDIYASTSLFYSQLEPLLRGYTNDAIYYGLPITMTEKAIKEYIDNILIDEKTQQEFVSKNGKIFRQDGRVVHINTF
jgi:hypothetical protein